MYDLLIIGGGPAGYHAAERAAHEGLKVLLFEERTVGGVCLNEGCVPSKALLYSAKIYDYMNGGGAAYGVTCENPALDYPAAVARKNKIVKKLVVGIESALRKGGVEIIRSHAEIKNRVEGGFAVEADNALYTGRQLLLCSGSKPVMPPIEGLQEAVASGFAMTNREILAMTEIPQHIVIVGGGVIGMEMASLMRSAGAAVTVIEMLDKIAGPADRDISKILQSNYEKKGVVFKLGAKLTKIESGSVTCELDGRCETIDCDRVLLSIGRQAVTAGLGLKAIGVLTERGAVITDEQMKTSMPGVFAAGDINGKSMLAHTAYREAEVAINMICGRKDTMNYDAIPSVIYTNPEVAGVGETLESAAVKGIAELREVRLPMMFSGRYMAENERGDGICKLVWAGKRLIGVHMIGNPASEIISTAAALISCEAPLEQMKRIVFPHPTVAEIIHESFYL